MHLKQAASSCSIILLLFFKMALVSITSPYSLPHPNIYWSHFQELADTLKLKIIPFPDRSVTIPDLLQHKTQQTPGIITARSGDGIILSFKMSAGSWKWDKYRLRWDKLCILKLTLVTNNDIFQFFMSHHTLLILSTKIPKVV